MVGQQAFAVPRGALASCILAGSMSPSSSALLHWGAPLVLGAAGRYSPWVLTSCPDCRAALSSVLASLSPALHMAARESFYTVPLGPEPGSGCPPALPDFLGLPSPPRTSFSISSQFPPYCLTLIPLPPPFSVLPPFPWTALPPGPSSVVVSRNPSSQAALQPGPVTPTAQGSHCRHPQLPLVLSPALSSLSGVKLWKGESTLPPFYCLYLFLTPFQHGFRPLEHFL